MDDYNPKWKIPKSCMEFIGLTLVEAPGKWTRLDTMACSKQAAREAHKLGGKAIPSFRSYETLLTFDADGA